MKGRGPLVPSVPCVLVIAGYLGAYSIMRGGRGRENTDKTTSETMHLLTSTSSPWHFSLSLHHRVTGRKHFSWKAVLLLCILWWREDNYWEEKRKEQKIERVSLTQLQPQVLLLLSTRRCRDTPNPTPAPISKTSVYSQQWGTIC